MYPVINGLIYYVMRYLENLKLGGKPVLNTCNTNDNSSIVVIILNQWFLGQALGAELAEKLLLLNTALCPDFRLSKSHIGLYPIIVW